MASGTFVSVVTPVLTSTLNNRLQQDRENRRWQREKLYELYSDADSVFTELIEAASTNNATAATNAYYRLICTLSRLSMACSESAAEELQAIEVELQPYLRGSLFQQAESSFLQEQRLRLIRLTQADSRLKQLFNT